MLCKLLFVKFMLSNKVTILGSRGAHAFPIGLAAPRPVAQRACPRFAHGFPDRAIRTSATVDFCNTTMDRHIGIDIMQGIPHEILHLPDL